MPEPNQAVLKLKNLKLYRKQTIILDNINLKVLKGDILGIVGPNGSGKSSLLQCLQGSNPKYLGEIYLHDKPINTWTAKEKATQIAVVSQEHPEHLDLTVFSILMIGRDDKRPFFSHALPKWTPYESTIIEKLAIHHLLPQRFNTLSGGEKQRVMIARALIQHTDILVLDEPTNHLDISHQLSILRFIKTLGLTVICSLHDINLTSMFCTKVGILTKGQLITLADCDLALSQKRLSDIYNVNVVKDQHPKTPHFRYSFY